MRYTENEKLERYTEKFELLKASNFQCMNLEDDELVRHCNDATKKDCFYPEWAVTNKGRVWSLSQNRWLIPRNQNGYWRIANIYVHLLVNHYFITKEEQRIMKIINEHNKRQEEIIKWTEDVHHITAASKMDSSIMTKEERITACMEINNKENLMVQIHETDHRDDHRIMHGKKTLGEENGTEQFDATTSLIKRSNPETHITYDENGKRVINMKLKLRGTTPEEDEELDRRFPQFRCW